MTYRSVPHLRGFYEPWRIPGEPLFLDEANFHLLVDQPLLAQARVALARSAGAWWTGKSPSSFQLHESEGELSIQLEPGEYAGFTAAGLPVHANFRDAHLAKTTIQLRQETTAIVVGIRAALRPSEETPPLVATRLPVAPTWLAMHLPVGIGRKTNSYWSMLPWCPRSVPTPRPDGLDTSESEICADSSHEKNIRDLAEKLEVRVLRLLEVAERYALDNLVPALHAVLGALLTIIGEPSLTVRWNAIVHAARLFIRVAHQNNPFETRWPEWIHENFGSVVSHFDTPITETIEKLYLYIHQIVSAAECLPEEFGPLRSDWWTQLSPGTIHILPGLDTPQRKSPELRAARLVGIGQDNATIRRWEIRPIAPSATRCDTIFLIMIPRKEVQKTVRAGLRLEMGNVAADYRMRFEPELAWGAYRAPDPVVAAYRPSGTITPLMIQYDVGLPPLAACLMFEVL